MSIQAASISIPTVSMKPCEGTRSRENEQAAPILEDDRYIQRPDFESWTVNGKDFKNSKELLASASDISSGQPATYKYKSGTLKDNLMAVAAGTALGAGMGAALIGVATIGLSVIGSVASVVLWPASFATSFPLLANVITGAGAGAAVFGGATLIGAGVNQFRPVKIEGALLKEKTSEGEKLLFKPSIANKKAIDIEKYDRTASTEATSKKEAWWEEADRVQRDVRAGYAENISY